MQLDAGPKAAISHEAAAALFGLPGYFFGPRDVTRPRKPERGVPSLGELHESRCLPESHVIVFDGIRVTRLPRVLFDLAGVVPEARWLRTFANTVARYPAVLRELHAMLPQLARRGRPGIALVRETLDAHPVGSIVEESGLERRVIEILSDAGIAVRKQVNLGDKDHWIGRVDLKVVDLPVTIEADSDLHHSSLIDRAADTARDADLRRAGFRVVRVDEHEIWHRPWDVVTKVQLAIAAANRNRSSVAIDELTP